MNRVAAVVVCLLLLGQVFAPSVAAGSGTQETTALQNEEEFDAFIEGLMDENDVAGASATLVEGGEVVTAEGYGYADYGSGEDVDEETLFRVGSVSKLFVWTAVMQGVEDGTLELDRDVDAYLEEYEFEGENVTLEHLGTHSAGYEDRIAGLFVREPEDAADWEEKLESEMPAHVWPAGERIGYSNHGAALAGLVVQEANDEPFESYVEREIFDPLEMDGATFAQPVPQERGTVSAAHVQLTDGFETTDYEVVGVPPAGSMSASATDMGNFMIATLQGGEFGDERILEESSVDEMFETRKRPHPDLNGMGYGYVQYDHSGERIVGHTGGTQYFFTVTLLFPERDVGVHVSFNSPGGSAAINDVIERFPQEFLGANSGGEATLEPDPSTTERADRYEGEYRTTRIQTTYEKLLGLANTMTVSVTDEGYLETSPLVGESQRWVETEPGVFEPGPNGSTTASGLVIEGDTLYMDAPTYPFERVSWYERTTVQGVLLVAGLLLALSPILVMPVNAYRTREGGSLREYFTQPRISVLACTGLFVAYLVGLLATLAIEPMQVIYGLTPWLRLALGIALFLALGVAVATALTARGWYVERTRTRARAGDDRDAVSGRVLGLLGYAYLAVVLAGFWAILWLLSYWNLLSAAL